MYNIYDSYALCNLFMNHTELTEYFWFWIPIQGKSLLFSFRMQLICPLPKQQIKQRKKKILNKEQSLWEISLICWYEATWILSWYEMRFADERLTEQTVWSAFKYLNKKHNKRTAGSFMASTHHHSRPVREEVYRAQSQTHLGTDFCPQWLCW